MNQYKDTQALQNFVHHHKLINSVSIVNFIGLVTIKTDKNRIVNRQVRITIAFDGYDNYGVLTIIDSDIDPYLFPTVLEAKWQTFEHIEEEYLKITGFHNSNPDIGKYEVKVTPLHKI